jgi:hypothetical protein
MEKRYYLVEVDEGFHKGGIDYNSRPGNKHYIEYKEEDIITESDLLHRIVLIRTMVETGQNLSQLNERVIDILLHGEKKEK